METERIVESQPDEPDWEDTVEEEEEASERQSESQAEPTWGSFAEVYSLFQRVLDEFGWEENPEGVWYSPELVIPIDDEFSIRGRALWPSLHVRHTVTLLCTEHGSRIITPLLRWESLDGRDHPHISPRGHCYSVMFDGFLYRSLPPEAREAFMMASAATILRGVEVINPDSPLTAWAECGSCERFRPYRNCSSCGSRFCEECIEDHEEDCSLEGAEDEEAREDPVFPPTTERIRRAILVGAGVTGSWVYPVLARNSQLAATVYDPDTMSPENPHGLWVDYRPTQYKVRALMVGAHPIVGISRRGTGFIGDADVLVLCPDNAQARLEALPPNIEGGLTVLDIRATPGGLTIWSFIAGEPLEETWRQSLQGYEGRERCGEGEGHDNVPMEAGTLAAAFTAWWIGHGMPGGVWTIPYGFQGMTEREAVIHESGD